MFSRIYHNLYNNIIFWREKRVQPYTWVHDYPDVSSLIPGASVYAHKCVLSARCEVMAVMFGGHFIESLSNMTEVSVLNAVYKT